jgi:beta-lactamase class D
LAAGDAQVIQKGKDLKYAQAILSFVAALTVTFLVAGRSQADDLDLAKLFRDRDVEGTMVISSLDGKANHIHNTLGSEARFVPASTFKLPNTLIALKTRVIKDEKEVIQWDGKDKGLPSWNRDQTLETAFPLSCVWFYQELAKRIGQEAYGAHLKELEYGNEKTGPEVTTFWLAGDLKISAKEQIDFLRKLYNESLPYSKSSIQLVKKLMVVEETPQYTIKAKTGLATQTDPKQGWYVGYVETKGQVWLFATNLAVRKKGDEVFRKEITMAALKAKGIL